MLQEQIDDRPLSLGENGAFFLTSFTSNCRVSVAWRRSQTKRSGPRNLAVQFAEDFREALWATLPILIPLDMK